MKKKISLSFISLFPDFIEQYKSFGIISRAVSRGIVALKTINLRDSAIDKRGTVDDRPFGGGVGMVIRPDVVYKAINKAKKKSKKPLKEKIVLLTPSGKKLDQKTVKNLAGLDHVIFVCGRYEGIDHRISSLVDLELSIGDYVLMGGELPALVVTEALLRHVPGVLGKDESAGDESFSNSLLEYPQFTKPVVWELAKPGKKGRKLVVPKVLRSGNHKNIAEWRAKQSLARTKKNRPDLLLGKD